MRTGTEVLHVPAEEDPWWVTAVPELRRVPPPTGYVDAWSFTSPVIDMPVYLQWLRQRLAELGGTLTRISMSSLPDSDDAVVVNCAGLGARRLAGDEQVRPVRGQVVVVDGVDLDHWWVDATGPTYVVPRERTVIVGGTDEQGDWSRTPSPDTATEILVRASRLVPELADANVVRHRVGLRPVRPSVRLESEGRLIHCYGHGGAGVTLSWGCANEVTQLVAGLT
jgi:D-amino-acid oxidase